MDGEQEARWLAAQEIGVGADLVPAALRQLEFLAAVDRRRWLYEGPLLERAIQRYKTCWLPLLAKHTQAAVVDGPLVVPLDCEWIWHCHRLNPVQYIKDCKRLYGRILDNSNVESSIQTDSRHQSENVWAEQYPKEPFELEYTSTCDNSIFPNAGAAEDISYDLVSAVKRQSSFFYQVDTPTMHDRRFLEEALARYKGFLYLIKTNQENKMKLFRVPTYDVDVMWHTHQLHPATYCHDMRKLLGRVLEHDDTDDDRSEGKKLDVGFSGTTEQFENSFGSRYWKAGAMYRGSLPSPVTSIPYIFSSEAHDEFGVGQAESQLAVLETTIIELFLQIVDIKNLPPAIPRENVYIWFTKNQSDMFLSDGGRLDISKNTGKSIGAGIQCEPTGELILSVLADQALSSKKPKKIGKISISLQEFTRPDSKLYFERWFELKPHDGHASSPPVSIRVAASSTVPVKAQQVLSMIRTEPFSLKTFLSPNHVKDQKMSCWTRFVYDCNTELIRLQIRDQKAKNGMFVARELVGVTKSSKKPFKLAELMDNKWSLSNSNLCITNDIKPSKDGSVLELKCDNKMIKLYHGRRLEFQRKCCDNHAKEDASAFTAVKFSAEHPYGKAIALLDTKSELIVVNEDWFLLPWIVISFLFQDISINDDAIPEPDTTMASVETVAAHAKSASCGPSCAGHVAIADDKVATVSSKAVAAGGGGGGNGQTESAGCGSGCGGGCGGAGAMVVEATKAGGGRAKSGGGCGGGCSGGCGGGCGTMAVESSKDDGHVKSGGYGRLQGGCGSGCGGGCGGACGGMAMEGSKVGDVKSGGCGSGCGGGCGGACGGMAMEGSKVGDVKSGGCGSGCGGGCGGACGGMAMEGSKVGDVKSGGCGSGCGGGCGGACGGMAMEGSKVGDVKSGGCGSGCGGGCGGACGGMAMEGSKVGDVKSGGCGGGCGGMTMESSNLGRAKSGGCGSGCGGGRGGGGWGGARRRTPAPRAGAPASRQPWNQR
uniref:Glycine-rich domain-containing protein-like n=1 Tax=Oryza brachyantha TaxID=4533 RepID=J3N9M9_ORYBR